MAALVEVVGDDTDQVTLPNAWVPRKHQRALWCYFEKGGLRADIVWHRRAGKDSTAINLTAVKAHERIGTYWHVLPEARQGRKVIWDALDKEGRRIIDQAFPEAIRESTNATEMQIKLNCGSVWQVVGSDNYNSLVGANPIGVVFSEWSISNPAAWDYIRPILTENGGWAIFIYTPRGKNHAKKQHDIAVKNKDWFAQILTVEDTFLVTPEQIQKERDDGMDDDLIEQEYFCSWSGSQKGAIYGEQLRRAKDEGRICVVPYVRSRPVNTFWDIGQRDAAVVICHQHVGVQHRFIRSHEAIGQDPAYFTRWMRDTGFMFGKHYLPHDAKNKTMASMSNPLGASVWDQLISLGLNERDMVLVPRVTDVWSGISTTRLKFDECWFNVEPDSVTTGDEPPKDCSALVNSLTMYRKKFDEARQCYADAPYHDWASNGADAFRQWAQGYVENAGVMSFTPPVIAKRPTLPGAGARPVGSRRVGY